MKQQKLEHRGQKRNNVRGQVTAYTPINMGTHLDL